ncbi:MAG: NADH-quinone oxidoreductase subunit NuoH [Candidatus Acididesulfobacter guangdongensis]|uniref:NADH-quinone oxidoreductase subunit H n=1 Tax=Acididesulfobacter guangdongensis TaxID=2597225 RepID=A0A519BI35_ACIG2|nr:MAG: NADH-quinone oxidoreductase subunit NuoH [Candidatus Acididesulfobacter guangdongensis]
MIFWLITTLIKILLVFGVLLLSAAYLTLLERKVAARIQNRLGPMEAGFHGMLQPIADGIKLFFKEDIIPADANRILFILAPIIVVIPALTTFAVIPFGAPITILGHVVPLQITNVNIGILFILALSSLGIYGVVIGGWASNSKYSLLGAIRTAAQMISYELSLALSIIGVIMIAGNLSLAQIVSSQAHMWFIVYQPVGFLIYLIASTAEMNRVPFDLGEAEGELVAGFHTEYSSMKFAFYFIGEYAQIVVNSAIITTLFLGGWEGPFLPSVLWFALKVFAVILIYIWFRWTYPRLRYDELMDLGWKILLPLALANIVVTGFIMILLGK